MVPPAATTASSVAIEKVVENCIAAVGCLVEFGGIGGCGCCVAVFKTLFLWLL